MHFTVAVTSALVASAAAASIPRHGKTGFIIKEVKNDKFVPNGLAQYRKALRKYGAHEHAARIGKILDGNVTNTPSDGGDGSGVDDEYLAPVQINGQTFNLDFDTGSADLWVLGDKVQTSGSTKHTIFEPKSGDSPLSGETWNITYGDGSGASGVVYAETVQIGSVAVTSQAVEVATSASSAFTSGTNDGLVGLAFSTINTVQPTQQKTFFDNAVAQGLLSKPVLGVSLKYKAPGSYDFGFVRTVNTTIAYTPVDSSQGFWSFTPDSVSVGGKKISASTLTGIADTGTTLALLPDDVVSGYYAGTGATNNQQAGGYTFDCSTKLPDFQVAIGKQTIVVPGEYINFAPISTGSQTCFGGIQSSSSIGINIYGDIFLKAAYVVFDSSVPQLGFAPGINNLF